MGLDANLTRSIGTLFLLGSLVIVFLLIQKRKAGSSSTGSSGMSFGKSNGTPTLNSFTTDFTEKAGSGKIDPVIGRHGEVVRLAQVLSRRSKNNAILVGPPGVGKTAIVEGLAERIAKGDVPDALKNKRVLALEVAGLLAGTKYRGEFEQRAKKIVQEISSANRSIILFIDEVHSVIQSQGTEGAVNFADILKPALARGDLQMIGATTYAEYEKYIQSDASLERRFQPIEVHEPTVDETLQILQGVKDKYREYHKVEFTDAALHTAVVLTKEKIRTRKLPDKAIDAIDEAGAMVKVAHVDPAVSAILHSAAGEKHPEAAQLWQDIQKIDTAIQQEKDKKKREPLIAKREAVEAELQKLGMMVVDSSDIEEVVNEWTKRFTV